MRAVSLVVCLGCLTCSLASVVPVIGKGSDAADQPLAGVRVHVLVIADRDAAGEPAAEMVVVCSMEAPRPVTATTGVDGSFPLAGLMEGTACLFVHSGGLCCTAQTAKTGQEGVVLRAPGGPSRYCAGEEIRPAGVAAAPGADEARQAQKLILEAQEKTKGGDTWDRWRLLPALARRDPQLALQTAAAHGDKDDGGGAEEGAPRHA